MRGDWLAGLVLAIVRGSATIGEAASFVAARFAPKPASFHLEGVRFPNADHILWSIAADVYFRRVYTPPGMEIGRADVVLDVGAHKGAFTAFAARRTEGIVAAYEPDPTNLQELVEFVGLNGLRNAQCHACALAASTGRGRLFLAGSSSRNSMTGFDQRSGEKLDRSIDIETISLDDALSGFDRVDLVKMDCEGAEVSILLSASDRTLAKIKRMAVEIHELPGSPEIRALSQHLAKRFSRVDVRQQRGRKLGYLYAWP